MNATWEQLISDMFGSKNLSGLQLRAFCTYCFLKDRIYTEVLPGALEVLEGAEINVKGDIEPTVWGKLTSAAIYLMSQSVLRHFIHERDNADDFNILIFNSFIKDFNERKETLIEYERDNPAMGRGQPVWAMGSQICKAVGHEDAFLALQFSVFYKQIGEIMTETLKDVFDSSLDELEEKREGTPTSGVCKLDTLGKIMSKSKTRRKKSGEFFPVSEAVSPLD